MALEEERKFHRLKDEALELCSKCESFNNSKTVQKKLIDIRDIWSRLRGEGYFEIPQKEWVKKYDDLRKLCITCRVKVSERRRKECSASPAAMELRKILRPKIRY